MNKGLSENSKIVSSKPDRPEPLEGCDRLYQLICFDYAQHEGGSRTNYKKAFSLLELLVYLSLISLLTLLICSFITTSLTLQNSTFLKLRQNLNNYFLTELILKDLSYASNKPLDWDSSNFVFKILAINSKNEFQKIDIGWREKGGVILRKEGKYDFTKKKWIERKSSIAAKKSLINNLNTIISSDRTFIKNVEISRKLSDKK